MKFARRIRQRRLFLRWSGSAQLRRLLRQEGPYALAFAAQAHLVQRQFFARLAECRQRVISDGVAAWHANRWHRRCVWRRWRNAIAAVSPDVQERLHDSGRRVTARWRLIFQREYFDLWQQRAYAAHEWQSLVSTTVLLMLPHRAHSLLEEACAAWRAQASYLNKIGVAAEFFLSQLDDAKQRAALEHWRSLKDAVRRAEDVRRFFDLHMSKYDHVAEARRFVRAWRHRKRKAFDLWRFRPVERVAAILFLRRWCKRAGILAHVSAMSAKRSLLSALGMGFVQFCRHSRMECAVDRMREASQRRGYAHAMASLLKHLREISLHASYARIALLRARERAFAEWSDGYRRAQQRNLCTALCTELRIVEQLGHSFAKWRVEMAGYSRELHHLYESVDHAWRIGRCFRKWRMGSSQYMRLELLAGRGQAVSRAHALSVWRAQANYSLRSAALVLTSHEAQMGSRRMREVWWRLCREATFQSALSVAAERADEFWTAMRNASWQVWCELLPERGQSDSESDSDSDASSAHAKAFMRSRRLNRLRGPWQLWQRERLCGLAEEEVSERRQRAVARYGLARWREAATASLGALDQLTHASSCWRQGSLASGLASLRRALKRAQSLEERTSQAELAARHSRSRSLLQLWSRAAASDTATWRLAHDQARKLRLRKTSRALSRWSSETDSKSVICGILGPSGGGGRLRRKLRYGRPWQAWRRALEARQSLVDSASCVAQLRALAASTAALDSWRANVSTRTRAQQLESTAARHRKSRQAHLALHTIRATVERRASLRQQAMRACSQRERAHTSCALCEWRDECTRREALAQLLTARRVLCQAAASTKCLRLWKASLLSRAMVRDAAVAVRAWRMAHGGSQVVAWWREWRSRAVSALERLRVSGSAHRHRLLASLRLWAIHHRRVRAMPRLVVPHAFRSPNLRRALRTWVREHPNLASYHIACRAAAAVAARRRLDGIRRWVQAAEAARFRKIIHARAMRRNVHIRTALSFAALSAHATLRLACASLQVCAYASWVRSAGAQCLLQWRGNAHAMRRLPASGGRDPPPRFLALRQAHAFHLWAIAARAEAVTAFLHRLHASRLGKCVRLWHALAAVTGRKLLLERQLNSVSRSSRLVGALVAFHSHSQSEHRRREAQREADALSARKAVSEVRRGLGHWSAVRRQTKDKLERDVEVLNWRLLSSCNWSEGQNIDHIRLRLVSIFDRWAIGTDGNRSGGAGRSLSEALLAAKRSRVAFDAWVEAIKAEDARAS